MGFGDFLRGVVAQVNPFDDGKTYGTYNPQRKKRPEEQNPITVRPAPFQINRDSSYDVDNPTIQVKKPQNVFGTLNNSKPVMPSGPPLSAPVLKSYDKPIQAPIPGTIVKPQQGIFDKVRDQFDANTQADKYRRAVDQYGKDRQNLINNGLAPNQANDLAGKLAQENMNARPVRTWQDWKKDEARGLASIASNASGGIIGMGRGIVETPSFLLRLPQFARLGAAKITGNKEAEQNLGNDNGVLAQIANTYDELVKPVTDPLTQAELSTDNTAKQLAPWTGNGEKNAAKVLTNLIPIILSAGLGFNKVKNPGKVKVSEDITPDVPPPTTPKPITVQKDIPVTAIDDMPEPVNVRNLTEPKPLIQEVGGDATTTTPDALVRRNAEDARAKAIADRAWEEKKTAGKPDYSVDGIKPVKTEPYKLDATQAAKSQDEIVEEYAQFLKEAGQGNGTQLIPDGSGGYIRTSNNLRYGNTKGKRMTKQDWLDEAKRQIEGGQAPDELRRAYKDATDPEIQSLLAKGEQVDAPIGKPIAVKQVNSIDVIDKTEVPKGLPETPGTVRTTTKADPQSAKTQLAAEQPAPAPIPKVGTILPDGTKVTKRMVASARNQRKLAKKLAKAQDETSESLEKIKNNAPNNSLDGRQPGIIQSDEIRQGKKGPYQVAHQADQTNELGTKSIGQVIEESDNSIKNTGTMTDRDIANVKAALDSGTVKPGSPEYKKLSDLYWKEAGTKGAQRLALRKQASHRVASAKQIYNKAVSKLYALADDPTKITAKHIDDIEKSANKYVTLRDSAKKAADDFNGNPSKENYQRFMDLDKQAARAEKEMAMTQYTAAKSSLKGNTNAKLMREIEDQADNADLYTMDFVDSSLLSSTGTFARNFVNASLGSLEEGLFGGIGARAGSLVKGTPVGGGVGRGSISGFKKGAGNIVDASKARFKNAGWNPIEHMKNWSTTGNQLGDSMIEGSIGRSVRNHYEGLLKKQGYKGDELRMRADVMARTDPDNLARDIYAPQARKDAGLGSGISKRSSIEKTMQRTIADGVAEVLGPKSARAAENFSKGVTRVVLGFPSAVGRSLVAGSQRIVPLANVDTFKIFSAPSSTLRAAAIKESIKKSGTAATIATVFYGLGANDMISGAYPKDQNERDRWEREGIKENSIKIGDAWYDAPSYLGSFGLPVLMWASMGRHGGVNKESLGDMKAIVSSLNPTDGLTKINDMLDGRTDFSKYTQNVATSAVRMATPYGSLLNQLSKVFDPTQKSTESDTWVGGVINKIIDGVPFLDKKLEDKTDKEGNVLYNPSVVETMAGAAGAVQKGGEERSQEINKDINDKLSTMKNYGAFDDENLKTLLQGEDIGSYKKAVEGKQLDESDIKQLQEKFVKGVSAGTDTAYLEREQYDTNLTVLKMKRDMMKDDPTVAPSKLQDIETDIKRGTVYKNNKVPYQDISDYKGTNLEDWRDMGDPDSDNYNKEMYDKLWNLDQLMTKEGVSYKKGDLTKNKYYLKEKKGGKGGSGGSSSKMGTDFGTLKASSYSPKVKEYETIRQQSGGVPRMRVIRPNIVHKITQSR